MRAFPARAGMNRGPLADKRRSVGVPRPCGDEPAGERKR